jgi:HSP20 family protein
MMMVTKCQPRSASPFPTWNPFVELEGFRRAFDQPFAGFVRGVPATVEAVPEWRPLMDVVEDKGGFTITLEIPGVKQEEVEISLDGETLTVKGERKHEAEVAEEGYRRIERSHGTFERTVILPPTVDVERIKATSRDGVLQIRLLKREEAKPKSIKVEAA